METLSSCLIWQIISFILPPNEYGCVYASLNGPAIDLQENAFSNEVHFDLGEYVSNCRIWGTENPHAYIEKPRQPKRVTAHFSLKMSKEKPLQSMAIVIAPCWTNFCSQKLKRRILATFGFNRTALRATQPKLYPAPCLLKIALSFGLLFVGSVKDKWYVVKLETIDA